MSSPFPERRRAERLDEMLRFAANGRRQHRDTDLDAELTPIADFAMSLAGAPAPAPTDDFRAGLRAMLIATIEREGMGATAIDAPLATEATVPLNRPLTRALSQGVDQPLSRPLSQPYALPARQIVTAATRPARGRRTRAAILIGVAAGALALSGVSLASTDSVPGDPLYSVKRSSEQAQLVLAGSDASRGQLHLEFAKSRMVEARSVSDDATGNDVLTEMDAETRAGVALLLGSAFEHHDRAAVDTVMAFVSGQRTALNDLRLALPRAAAKLQASLDLVREVETRANVIRAAILSGCTVAEYDQLGPRPTC